MVFWSGSSDWILSLLLVAVAVHSLGVGGVLIARPVRIMRWMGFSVREEPFFPFQGGVFHLILAVCYLWGAIDPEAYPELVLFAVVAKMAAACFLLAFHFFLSKRWVVFASGLGDGAMGLAVLICFMF